MTNTIYSYVFENLNRNPSKTFISTYDNKNITYQDLLSNVTATQNYLISKGVSGGDRILIQCQKCPEFIYLYLACSSLNAIFVPLNPAYTNNELDYFIKDTTPTLFICDDGQFKIPGYANKKLQIISMHEIKSHLATVNDNPTIPQNSFNTDDTAVIIYTSGTTGKPKGAMLSHRNLITNGQALCNIWEINKDDTLLHMLPLYHVHGLFFGLNTILMSCAKIILTPKFDLTWVHQFIKASTILMGVPTFYTRILNDKKFRSDNFSHMRLLISGSAPMLEATHHEFFEKTGKEIVERYGMSETGIISSNPIHGTKKVGSVGTSLPNQSFKILDNAKKELPANEIGHIYVSGDNVTKGYWNKPELSNDIFTTDGYFHTGDLGYIDDEGYLSITGRAKDLIITGGLNVYPIEVEAVINEVDEVKESAVIAVPHDDFGECVIAVITCTSDNIDIEKIKKHTSSKLANYKQPKSFKIVDEIPRNVMGKVQKASLREQFKNLFQSTSEEISN